MNWKYWRAIPWVDTRSRFVAALPRGGRLLDLGSSDGGTLRHMHELRPDVRLASADIAGSPESYPPATDFRRADFDRDRLPWPDDTFDGVTCMHVVEHLQAPAHLLGEIARVLRPGGKAYVETPHPDTAGMKSAWGDGTGTVTLNFFDDPTHVRPVPVSEIAGSASAAGLSLVESGVSRNLLFAAAYPVYRLLGSTSRSRFVAQIHWTGWSAYAILARR